MRRHLAPAVALAATGCVSGTHPAGAEVSAPSFDALTFFAGPTEGRGRLKIMLKRPVPTLVEGRGQVGPDGSITLVQQVRQGDAPVRTRTWHLHATEPGHYAGTLTDAAGAVNGKVAGNRLHLRFVMKGGLKAEQWIDLQRGGRVAQNVMVVSKFGVPVARLDETITRLDP